MIDSTIDFYLFSSSYELAQKLYYTGNLKAVYMEKKHLNQNIVNFCSLRNIKYFVADNLNELLKYLPSKTKNSLGISFGEGFIFKNEQINLFEYGIWNIHTGKLPDNRGRHPIGWSFINNDKYFTVTLHSIDEKIDMGVLIYEENIERDINDDTQSISEKILNVIKSNFLNKGIENFNNNRVKTLETGNYNKNLIGKFNYINSKDYTASELFSIFKSQLIYGALNVDGKMYDECNFYFENSNIENCDIIMAKDSVKIVLRKQKEDTI